MRLSRLLYLLVLIPQLVAAQPGVPDWGATGPSPLLPLSLWGRMPQSPFFEHPALLASPSTIRNPQSAIRNSDHPVDVLTASRPRATATWMLDRTLDERSALAGDRTRIQGTQQTLDLVVPLMSGPDSTYLGHLAVRLDHADRHLTLPLSSDGRWLRYHRDEGYGEVTYARAVGSDWRFGGSVGIVAQPDDRQVNVNVQSTYEHAGLLQASVTIGRRAFRHGLDMDFKKGLRQTRYRVNLPPSERRVTVAVTSFWTPSLSWSVEGNWRTIQSAGRATGSEGAFRLPIEVNQWTVRTGPTLQLFSGAVRLWSRVQGERDGADATLLRSEGGDLAGRLRNTGRRWGWEAGLFSIVSRKAGLAVHATEHRVTADASGYLSPQQIVDLPFFFDWFIGRSLERQFYRTTMRLSVRGLGLVYYRKVNRSGLLGLGAHRASVHLDGEFTDWSYPRTGSLQSHDRQVAMRPKILNTLFIEARYPIRSVTLHYRLTRLIPQQGPAAISTGWSPVDTQPFKDRRLRVGSLHVWSLSYGF